MNMFIYVTGIASLLGVVLQLKDAFPKHRDLRKNLLLVIFGTFIGTLLGGIKIVQVSLSAPSNQQEVIILVIVVGLLFVIIGLVAGSIFKKSDTRQKSLAEGAGNAAALFFICLIPILLFLSFSRTSVPDEMLGMDEAKLLVDAHEHNRNYDRVIVLLDSMKSKMRLDDPRLEAINNRLESLKKKQLADMTGQN